MIISPYSSFVRCLIKQGILRHLRFIAALGILVVEDRTLQFIFRKLFHHIGGLLVQSATVEILRNRVHATCVYRLDGMIVRKLSLLSAFEITNLSASTSELVPRRKSSAVFGLPCIGGQKPLAADGA